MTGLEQIKQLYQDENDVAINEDQFTKVTLRMRVEDAALFAAIADRFSTTRMELLEPVFRQSAIEMFQGLEPKDRKTVASKADRQATEILKKQGVTVEMYPAANGAIDELCGWTIYADICNQADEERKGDK